MRGIITKAVRSAGINRRLGRGVATAAGLVACAGIVWSSSHAAFTATTSNTGNSLSAGTLTLTDNDGSTAMFTAPTLAPGETASMCISVNNTGTLAAPTKIYFPQASASEVNAGSPITWADSNAAEMDDNTTLHVEVNDVDLNSAIAFDGTCTLPGAGTFGDVVPASATIRSLIAGTTTNQYLTNSLPTTTIGAGKWRVFKFTYLLSASATNSVQGDGVGFGVTWEARR